MFLNQPYNSARYVTKIFEIQKDNLFKDNDQESWYFASALCLYKLNNLINGKKFSANKYSFLRWHIINIYKHIVVSKVEDIKPNSTKASKYGSYIIQSLVSDKKSYEKYFQQCFEIIERIGIPTKDVIKRSKFNGDLTQEVEKYLNEKLYLGE